MTALSADRITKGKHLGNIVRYQMAQSSTIYAGSMVMLNSSGLAEPAAASVNNNGCVGIAIEQETSAASGDYFIKVQEGTFLLGGDTLGQASVGDVVYADDDQTIDETQATNCPKAGVLVKYESASSAWVKMGVDVAK